ncbi:MAG: 3-phosphoshikimate 1-carboxyvinyltransferase [Candidatus Latescibacteria bacterium]|jgi:3-phosphoshikimate 1-carboxyvinyltransferase|nr:3-phosphoshikimate 1-carboxyvinyltransferase [Candidatus Latescibacterota bacterium]
MQTLQIQPLKAPVDANITIPGSKSITNRALIIAALAKGETHLTHALYSDDTRYMAAALRELGISVEENEEAETFTIQGTGGQITRANAELHIGNSGTAARFLTAFLGLGYGTYTVDGIDRMRERPIKDLLDGLRPLGVTTHCEGKDNECPPVIVIGSGIKGGQTAMPGHNSSQYFTAILQVAPYAQQDVHIQVQGDLVSKPYIDLTIAVMRDFGIEVTNHDYQSLTVCAGQRYQPRTYEIEPDASNASYFFAAAALTGGRVKINRLTTHSAQGDIGFVDILAKMGCQVRKTPDGIEVQGPKQLTGLNIDMNGMSDVAQTLCAIAPFANSPVTVRNIAHVRIKETDRIAALETEIKKLGIRIETSADGFTVYPTDHIQPAALDTYDDHRMAMSLSLIGLKIPGIVINDPACVNKTFPTYFNVLDSLRK